jgi:L,D-transpeptidase YbiS
MVKRSLEVFTEEQIAELWEADELLKTYKVSTAANGLGVEEGSHCTPAGRLKVAEKIGAGAAVGTVFRSRVATGEVWPDSVKKIETPEEPDSSDLILTRILWLDGLEPSNANTKERFIYLHGTNHEAALGQPVSHGCIRFSNKDIVEVFDLLDVGSAVLVF